MYNLHGGGAGLHGGRAAHAQYGLCARKAPKNTENFTRSTESTVDGLGALAVFQVYIKCAGARALHSCHEYHYE